MFDHECDCQRCGATWVVCALSPASGICNACRKLEREPQGEAMRLFSPAPNQLADQMSL